LAAPESKTSVDAPIEPSDREAMGRLWSRIAEGDQKARLEVMTSHLGLVKSIAWDVYEKASLGYLEIRDLMQLGAVGLLESISRFEYERGGSFAGFASKRIHGAMLNGLEQYSEYHAQSTFRRRVRKERIDSLAEFGKKDAGNDAFMQMVEATLGLAIGCLLEDTSMYVDEGRNASQNYLGTGELATISDSLRALVSELPEPDRQVIEMHYLAGLPFSKVATLLGLSKGRVSQLHGRAIKSLRILQGRRVSFNAML